MGIRAFALGFFPLSSDLRSLRSRLLTEIGLGRLSAPAETDLQAPSLLPTGAGRTGWILGLH